MRPYRITFLWNDLGSEERDMILGYSLKEDWVEEKWVRYTVFLAKYDGKLKKAF